MREAAIAAAVMTHWRAFGVPGTFLATLPNMGAMGQHGLTKGLPDLMAIGPQGVAFIELKTEYGRLSPHQQEFFETCIRWGVASCVTYGRDQPIEVLEDLGLVRKRARAA